MQSERLAVPLILLLAGIGWAAYVVFAEKFKPMEFAVACLVAAIGVHEIRTSRLHEDEMERFER